MIFRNSQRPTVFSKAEGWLDHRLIGLDINDEARPMASEFELKLELSYDAAEQAARLPWLRELASAPVRKEKLISVYFDTSKRKLHRAAHHRVRLHGKGRGSRASRARDTGTVRRRRRREARTWSKRRPILLL
jgi:hypothetical protein